MLVPAAHDGRPEVPDPETIVFADEDVARLQVSVDDLARVELVQPQADLDDPFPSLRLVDVEVAVAQVHGQVALLTPFVHDMKLGIFIKRVHELDDES